MNIFMIIIICIILLFIANYFSSYSLMYIEPYYDAGIVSVDEYAKTLKNNHEKELYRIGLAPNTEIYTEDCNLKCNATSCRVLDERTKNLDKCLKCNATKNKCFRKSIIGGNCDDCDESIEDKSDCYNIYNFGCVPPDNLDAVNGVKPYYIQVPDTNPSSPFNKKCVFCWNILDNL